MSKYPFLKSYGALGLSVQNPFDLLYDSRSDSSDINRQPSSSDYIQEKEALPLSPDPYILSDARGVEAVRADAGAERENIERAKQNRWNMESERANINSHYTWSHGARTPNYSEEDRRRIQKLGQKIDLIDNEITSYRQNIFQLEKELAWNQGQVDTSRDRQKSQSGFSILSDEEEAAAAQTYSAVEFYKSAVKEVQAEEKTRITALNQKEKELQSLRELAKNGNHTSIQRYNSAVEEYNQMYGEYQNFYQEQYSPIFDMYEKATGAFAPYQEYYVNQWNSARDDETVSAELAAVRQEVDALEIKSQRLHVNRNFAKRHNAPLADLEQQIQAVDRQRSEKQELVKILEQELGYGYRKLDEEKDFEQGSRYVSTYDRNRQVNEIMPAPGENAGFADPLYDYINGNENAGDLVTLTHGISKEFLQEMTPEERRRFNYLYHRDEETGDADHSTAYGYIEFLTGDLNARQRKTWTEEAATYAKEHPWLASAKTVLTAPTKVMSYLDQMMDYATTGEMDQNSFTQRHSYLSSAMRNAVSENWSEAGKFFYNVGLSMADFLYTSFIFSFLSSLFSLLFSLFSFP